MVAAGGAILIVAVLAAAISALGPKYRPTPLLTPLFAGIFAALLATTAIYAVRANVAPKRRPLPPSRPSRPRSRRPPSTSALVDAGARGHGAAAGAGSARTGDGADASMPASSRRRPRSRTRCRWPTPSRRWSRPRSLAAAEDSRWTRPAMGGPLVDMANAVVPPARAVGGSAPGRGADRRGQTGDGQAAASPWPRFRSPPRRPKAAAEADPNAPLNLAAGFDPSGPTEPAADGPPMTLDVADAAPAHRMAIPPLPRIRPCGGAGPACP